MSLLDRLARTARVWARSSTQDEYGGIEDSESLVVSTVAWFDPRSGEEHDEQGRDSASTDGVILFPDLDPDVTIRRGHVVEIEGQGRFAVESDRDYRPIGRHLEVPARVVRA